MCLPIAMAAASAVIGTISSVASFMGQNAAAAANTRDANLGYANAANEAGAQATQIDTQQSENTVTAMINGSAARGRISAGAASLGAGAESTGAASNAADFAAGRSLGVEDINSENERLNVQQDMATADLRRRSQINQVQPGNPLSMILGIGGAALQGGSLYSSLGGKLPGGTPSTVAKGA